MKFSIDIDLNSDEIFLLRMFLDKGIINKIFFNSELKKYKESLNSLYEKGLINIDYIQNMEVSSIGSQILEMIDRDKKINDLLSE